jgi:hypothetical protein
VLDATIQFETRPGNQGYLQGRVVFVDGSHLFFREYLDIIEPGVDKLMYSYHYQEEENQLIFRYDNARHKPTLPFRSHKHIFPNEIVAAIPPTLDDVLAEIVDRLSHI